MDHITRFQTMSIRRLAAAGFVVTLVGGVTATVVAHATSGWMVPATGFAVFAGAVWWQLDRLLAARERDRRALPARPELYDFDKLNPPMHVEEVGGKTLRQMTYVVFDTETTGLKPTAGDEIISIAGVRVVDGVINEAEPFTRLVDPGMPIPKESIRFHGITDDMVKGESQVSDVIRDFREWVGDAVLVAHNAAFDMKFLKLKEDVAGVRFDNLVLDTLLLSVFADQDSRNHSLDAIAERMGVNIEGRHTALGDSIATAKVFVRLLEMLEARGVTTLRHAIRGSVKVEDILALDMDF